LRCTADIEAGSLVVHLHDVARGIAPGQTAVVYDGERVVGSATIQRAS
jgi:tRNA-uridine 2-sulfurtransferase